MSNSQPRRTNGLFAPRAKKERRPAGVSRRRKKQFSFEPLESRQVMSASAIVQPFELFNVTAAETTTSTTSTAGGAAAQQEALARELWWYQQMASANTGNFSLGVNAPPTDPLFGNQWHLLNTGQNTGGQDFQPIFGVPGEDINVVPAWNLGYTGAGVSVAVIDSGVQLNHPDLAANIDLERAFDAITPAGNGNPFFFDPTNAHGTAVAGLIGAVANNGIGGAGVAPGVTLVPIRLIDFGSTDQSVVAAFRHTVFNDIDITNNSWGPTFVRGLFGPGPEEFLALRDSVLFGREGKGVIHVFASGNDAGPGFNEGFDPLGGFDSSAYNGYVNTRYVIGVTGVDHDGSYNNVDGTITAYPEISSAILVAAPTGSNAGPVIVNDSGLGSGLWTTDLTGDFGYNVVPDPNGQETQDAFYPFDRDFLANPDYTSRMNGTSGAAPLVSGVIALMLEANPNLTWRDVQEILVRSARMNKPLDVPQTGQGQGTGSGTQSTWIVNQVPIFHDPDFFFPGIPTSPDLQTLFPILDPNFTVVINGVEDSFHGDHHVATPQMMTNGAGYTVSQGIGPHGEQIGYGHGVIDAELAVLMAEQWHTKNQALAPELSFTSFVAGQGWNLPAAQQGNVASGRQIVPGGIGGNGPFIAWWNEYYAPVPNFGALPPLYRGDSAIELNVPANQTMSVENVEVKVSISGGDTAVLDNVRLLLISPDGTHSELNHYWIQTPPALPFTNQLDDPALTRGIPIYGTPGSIDTNPDEPFVWSFRSTRHWGERSNDAIVFDPTTGEPVIDALGFFKTGIIDPNSGTINPIPNQAMTQGWRLVIENWNFATTLNIEGVEIAWHGRPIDAATQRISGAIGVDEDRDDFFNYTRMVSQDFDIDGDPTINRLGEISNVPDVNQEDFAENITVVARRVSDNQVAARFVTGHDGNFYFDLVPDEYIISIEDPEGRAAQEDTVTPAGLLQDYKTEWHITPEWFKVWDKVTNQPTETIVDANGTPQAWLDDNGDEQAYGMRGINFLLDPGEQPLDQVSFSGTVYADTNGDGAFNSVDTVLPNVQVYVDANRNGSLDSGEVSVLTDASGQYTLVQTGVTAAAVMNVGIVTPAQWTPTNPANGLHQGPNGLGVFVLPGETFGGFDFFIDPPANNAGGGGADQPGILLGSVFEDLNSDGVRNGVESGVEGVTVWLDANNNGVYEVGVETATQTNQFGGYVFTAVPPGQHIIRIEITSPLTQTTPLLGQPWVVNLTGSSTISNLVFGFNDLAVNDFGDLPNSYEMRPDGNGGFVLDPARHKKGKYWLGTNVDGELGNSPTPNADGDDLLETDDENGVVFDPIAAGATGRLTVTANTYTGYLQGWVDWNDDGDFLDDGERIATDQLLVAGQNFVFYNVADDVTVNNVRARFRFGEHSTDPSTGAKRPVNTPWGFAAAGEVEDYYVPVAFPAGPIIVGIPGDFDADEDVDGRDFLSWQRNLGTGSGATREQGDADADGDVDANDLGEWNDNFGSSGSAAALSGLPANFAAIGGSLAAAGAGNAFDRSRLSSAAAWSISTEMSSDIATTVESHALSARPALMRVAGRLADLADRLQAADGERLDAAAERVSQAAARIADRIDGLQLHSLRRDRALDDLFGLADQDSDLDELAAELAETSDGDAAFAELADRFGRRRR